MRWRRPTFPSRPSSTARGCSPSRIFASGGCQRPIRGPTPRSATPSASRTTPRRASHRLPTSTSTAAAASCPAREVELQVGHLVLEELGVPRPRGGPLLGEVLAGPEVVGGLVTLQH